jgi:hypothetical protein
MGGGQLLGAPSYQGPLIADQNGNLITAQNSWAPTNSATDYQGNMLGQYGLQNSSMFAPAYQNMLQYGGIGGAPTQNMSLQQQYGGSGAPAQSMSSLMQYGAAGPAGQALSNMSQAGVSGTWGNPLASQAQSGVAGTWGNPLQATAVGGQGSANQGLSPFATAGGQQSLQNIIGGQGNPINQLPAWQAMVGAQQQNIAQGANALAEQFNGSDNRFSTAFGTAAQQYQNQAVANQNAQLGQMTATAQQQAQNNLLQASSSLGGLGLGAAGQESAQQYGAGSYLAGLGSQAGSQLANLGAGAATNLSNISAGAAGNLFQGSNQAAMGMYNAQNQMLPQFMNYQQGQQQLGQSGAYNLNNMLNQNLGTGMQLGQNQFNNQQLGINNNYQNWYQSQPGNNPLLQYMYGGATGYTSNTQGSSSPGIMGLLGSLGGAAIGKFSDRRLKEDITKVGEAGGLNIYTYKFKGLPAKQLGFIAQEVNEKFPEAVIPGDDSTPWMIKPNVLLESLARSSN